EPARHEVNHDGGQHGDVGLAQHAPECEREHRHEHDIERQHVEVQWLELQHQAFEDGLDRIVDQARNLEFVYELRDVAALGDEADVRDIDNEKQDVRDIEWPDALQQLGCDDHEFPLQHHPRIDE